MAERDQDAKKPWPGDKQDTVRRQDKAWPGDKQDTVRPQDKPSPYKPRDVLGELLDKGKP